MKHQTEPITFSEDEMISIILSDGDFEINKELLLLINETIKLLGLSSIQDLEKITEEDFFNAFTPLMNEHYNL